MTRTALVTASHDTKGGSMPDIRDQIRAFSLSKAEGPDREIIRELYRMFDEHNAAHFGGRLDPVVILITPPTSARASADAAEFSGFGCRQQMRIRPSIARGSHNADRPQGVKAFYRMVPGHALENRLRWLSDLVLHEMIHLWLNQIEDPRRDEHQGHGAPYTAECNRIGGMLGLDPVVSRRRKTDGARVGISSDWPQNVRPGGPHGPFYGTLWELVPAEAPDPVPDEEPFHGFERARAVIEDPRFTDDDTRQLLKHFSWVQIAVAVMPDLPPGDRLVTANGDAANGSDAVIDGKVLPDEPPGAPRRDQAAVPRISAQPEPASKPVETSSPTVEPPAASTGEGGLRVWRLDRSSLDQSKEWAPVPVLRVTPKRVFVPLNLDSDLVRRASHDGSNEIALDRTKLESEGVVQDRRTRKTFFSDAGKTAVEAKDAAREEECRKAAENPEEGLNRADDYCLAWGRQRFSPDRDPNLPLPRAVLGIPDDAPLTRQVIRDAFEEQEREARRGKFVTTSDDTAHLEEARYRLLEELASDASVAVIASNDIDADAQGMVDGIVARAGRKSRTATAIKLCKIAGLDDQKICRLFLGHKAEALGVTHNELARLKAAAAEAFS